jgi:Ser/Thr protein kinase RdoA (MazF antagonist)
VFTPEVIRQYLARWPLVPPVVLEPLAGGINAQVWLIRTGAGRFVAKAANVSQLLAGLQVAEILDSAGFGAGGPLPATSGETSIPLGNEYALALLHFVPGRPLDRSRSADRTRIGATLGTAHSILRSAEPPTALARWPWLWLTDFAETPLPNPVEGAVRNAVRRAEALTDELQLTQGVLHGDVSARDFLLDQGTGRTGLVDWGAAMYGPLLYDLGSFVALARLLPSDRDSFIASYRATAPLAVDELPALGRICRASVGRPGPVLQPARHPRHHDRPGSRR